VLIVVVLFIFEVLPLCCAIRGGGLMVRGVLYYTMLPVVLLLALLLAEGRGYPYSSMSSSSMLSTTSITLSNTSSTTLDVIQCFKHSKASIMRASRLALDHVIILLVPLNTLSDSALIASAVNTSIAIF